MARFGLIVDLNRCTGCMTCVIACKQENLTRPGIQWNSVFELEDATVDHISYVRHACMHCDAPPCLEACAEDAISKRPDGIVMIDQKRCVGCGDCIDACPYGIPQLNPDKAYFPGKILPYEKNTAQHRIQLSGKASKCTLCAHRIDQGKKPVCVATCPSSAIIFGDLDDPESPIRKKLRESKQLLVSEGTHPKVSFIAPKNIIKLVEGKVAEFL